MKNHRIAYIVLAVVALAIVLVGLLSFSTAVAQPDLGRGGEPPVIEYIQMPINGAQPAACAGQVGCVTMCFYVNEDDNTLEPNPEYLWELSCIPMIVQN